MTADDEKKNETLLTPFGEIKILIDGKPIPYVAQRGKKLEGMCLHVLRRYQIAVQFTPDGEKSYDCVSLNADCQAKCNTFEK